MHSAHTLPPPRSQLIEYEGEIGDGEGVTVAAMGTLINLVDYPLWKQRMVKGGAIAPILLRLFLDEKAHRRELYFALWATAHLADECTTSQLQVILPRLVALLRAADDELAFMCIWTLANLMDKHSSRVVEALPGDLMTLLNSSEFHTKAKRFDKQAKAQKQDPWCEETLGDILGIVNSSDGAESARKRQAVGGGSSAAKAGEGASSAGKPKSHKPPGRPPKGKTWSEERGTYIADTSQQGGTLDTLGGSGARGLKRTRQ